MEVVDGDMSDDMVLVADFRVIVGKRIPVRITRRLDRHDNIGGPRCVTA
jgi:hypothetical protein